MCSEYRNNAGLKITFLVCVVFIFSGYVFADDEISNSEVCREENLFVGVNFAKSEYINFQTDPDERKEWNMIMLNEIRRITHKNYFLTYPGYLGKYAECKNQVVQCLMDSYVETYVGGGERTGTISLTFLFFENPASTVPKRKISVEATGGSDYGHSNPMEYAIEEACSELKVKFTEGGIQQIAEVVDVCKDENLFIGVEFSKSKFIEFKFEPDEVNGCNALIRDAVAEVSGVPFRLINQNQLDEYRNCKNEVVQCQLESYSEVVVDGGERTGTIGLTFLVFSNPSSTSPQKKLFIEATGRSDYGHSNPLRYAVEKACYLYKNKVLQSGYMSAEDDIDVCKDGNIFVGIDIAKSEYINFNVEKGEINRWNTMILDAVSDVTKKPFYLTYMDQMDVYRDWQGSAVKCILDSYREIGEEDDDEIEGNITLTFQFFKSIRDSFPEKSRTIIATGESDGGHSRPLEGAILAACSEFKKSESENGMPLIEYGPSLGLHYADKMGGFSINFDLGFTKGRSNSGMAIGLGKDIKGDTLISENQEITKEFYWMGIGGYYGFIAFKNPYVRVIPKIKAGYWQLGITEEISEPTKSNTNPYGQNQWVIREKKTLYNYYLFPCIDIRAGSKTKWGRVLLGVYIGDGSPIWTAQFGGIFTGK